MDDIECDGRARKGEAAVSDIVYGDWVRINEAGPYKVTYIWEDRPGHDKWAVFDDGTRARLEWCVKVESPWEPKPGTVWRGRTGLIVHVAANGALQTLSRPLMGTVEDVLAAHGPMTELVPRLMVDIDEWCRVYVNSERWLTRWEGWAEEAKDGVRERMKAVLENAGLL